MFHLKHKAGELRPRDQALGPSQGPSLAAKDGMSLGKCLYLSPNSVSLTGK